MSVCINCGNGQALDYYIVFLLRGQKISLSKEKWVKPTFLYISIMLTVWLRTISILYTLADRRLDHHVLTLVYCNLDELNLQIQIRFQYHQVSEQ